MGFPPFFDQSRTNTEERIVHSMPAFPAGMSEEAKSFITIALAKHPSERPTTLEMLHHPWIARFSTRRSMRNLPGAASPLPSPSAATPRRPPAALAQPAAAVPVSPASGQATPLRPPAAAGYPTLGSLLSPQLDKAHLAAHGSHGVPNSPQSTLMLKNSSSESQELLLHGRLSAGSSYASSGMQL